MRRPTGPLNPQLRHSASGKLHRNCQRRTHKHSVYTEMANQAPRAQHLCNTTMNIQVQQNSTQQPAIRVSRRTFVTRSQKFKFRVKPSAACLTLIHHPRDGRFYNLHLLDGSTPRPFAEPSHYEECRDRRKRPNRQRGTNRSCNIRQQ